jgi:hypothetical protein
VVKPVELKQEPKVVIPPPAPEPENVKPKVTNLVDAAIEADLQPVKVDGFMQTSDKP